MKDFKDRKIRGLILDKLNILAIAVYVQFILLIIVTGILVIHLKDDAKLKESLNKNFEIVEKMIKGGRK